LWIDLSMMQNKYICGWVPFKEDYIDGNRRQLGFYYRSSDQAVGTLLLAAIAIWQDKLRPGPKLAIRMRNNSGVIVKYPNGEMDRWFHLTVENKRTWATARNVRVVLRQVFRKDASGLFKQDSSHNNQLTWAPAYAHDTAPNITKDDDLDLGYISKNSKKFTMSFYGVRELSKATLEPKESMIIGLAIRADNFDAKDMCFFRIDWNGIWEDDDSKIQKNLVIQRVDKSVIETG